MKVLFFARYSNCFSLLNLLSCIYSPFSIASVVNAPPPDMGIALLRLFLFLIYSIEDATMKLIQTLLLSTFAFTSVAAFAEEAPATQEAVVVSTQEEATSTESTNDQATIEAAEEAQAEQ